MIVPYHPTWNVGLISVLCLRFLSEFYSILRLCGSACTACM